MIHPALSHRISVGTQRHEVMFKDGTHISLMPVIDNGVPSLFKRAVNVTREGQGPLVIDLRQLSQQLAEDLPPAPERDRPGLVFYGLRQEFSTAELVMRQVLEHGQPLKQAAAA